MARINLNDVDKKHASNACHRSSIRYDKEVLEVCAELQSLNACLKTARKLQQCLPKDVMRSKALCVPNAPKFLKDWTDL